jgi:hypothetical protein
MISTTLKSDLFWCGTGLGFVAGFLLIRLWPEGLAMFTAFILGVVCEAKQ